jgi:hypothetical protein
MEVSGQLHAPATLFIFDIQKFFNPRLVPGQFKHTNSKNRGFHDWRESGLISSTVADAAAATADDDTRAQAVNVTFLKTCFNGQSFTAIQYSATNSGLPTKNSVCFQGNTVNSIHIWESMCMSLHWSLLTDHHSKLSFVQGFLPGFQHVYPIFLCSRKLASSTVLMSAALIIDLPIFFLPKGVYIS